MAALGVPLARAMRLAASLYQEKVPVSLADEAVGFQPFGDDELVCPTDGLPLAPFSTTGRTFVARNTTVGDDGESCSPAKGDAESLEQVSIIAAHNYPVTRHLDPVLSAVSLLSNSPGRICRKSGEAPPQIVERLRLAA